MPAPTNDAAKPKRGAWLFDVGALFVALLAVGLLFIGVVTGRAHFWGDFVSWYFPAHDYAAESWRAGRWPLWNPYTDGGMPFAGEADHGAFYPPSLLLHQLATDRLSLFRGLEMFALFHVWLSVAATYGLVRSLGCSRTAALFSGIAYGLGGTFVARSAQVSLVCAQAFTPIVLGGAYHAVAGRRLLPGLAAGGIALGLLTLAGSPATLATTEVGLVVVALASAFFPREPAAWGRRTLRALLVIGGISAIGLLTGAVQLVPMVELVGESERAAFTYADLSEYTVSPESLVMLLVPKFYGWLIYDEPSYWGPNNYVELSGYIGLLPLILAPLALRLRDGRAGPWAAAAVVTFLLALGPYGGLHWLFYRTVPLIGMLRTPARYLQIWGLATAVLAGLALDARTRGEGGDRARAAREWLSGALLLATALTVALALAWPTLRNELEEWKKPLFLEAIGASLRSCAWTLAALVALRRLPRASRLAGALCVLALVNDLVVQGQRVGVDGNIEDFERLVSKPGPIEKALGDLAKSEPPFRLKDRYSGHGDLMLLRLQADSGPGRHLLRYQNYDARILSNASPLVDLFNIRYLVQAQNVLVDSALPNLVAQASLWLAGGAAATLPVEPAVLSDGLLFISTTNSMDRRMGDTVATLEVTGADGETRVVPVRLGIETGDFVARDTASAAKPVGVEQFVHITDAGARLRNHFLAEIRFPPLRVESVRATHVGGVSEWVLKELYLLTRETRPAGFERVVSEMRGTHVKFVLYENKDALPRAFLVGRHRIANSPEAALDVVSAPGFDPRREVVIERPSGAPTAASLAGRGEEDLGSASVAHYSPDEVRVAASVSEGGAWLVLADVDYPGWSATVDGIAAPIARADGLLRAVWLPRGDHDVVFRYTSRSIGLGVAFTGLGAVLSLVAALGVWLEARRGARAATIA